MPPALKPTPAELAILQILWQDGPATVRDVCDALNRQRPTGYTTVLKTLQIMTTKGLVKRTAEGRAHIYAAARKPEQTQRQLLTDLLTRVFHGSAATLLQHALAARRASPREIAAIRAVLDEYENQHRKE